MDISESSDNDSTVENICREEELTKDKEENSVWQNDELVPLSAFLGIYEQSG